MLPYVMEDSNHKLRIRVLKYHLKKPWSKAVIHIYYGNNSIIYKLFTNRVIRKKFKVNSQHI